MTNFQIAITGTFVFFILVGVTFFAAFGGSSSSESLGNVEIWGTVDQIMMDEILNDLWEKENKIYDGLKYREIDEGSFDIELAEALASGGGPDVFFLPQDSILKHQDKIYAIPYENYSIREFKDSFIEGGELFLGNKGIIAFPFMVDPMVMYWNRDIFSEKGVPSPPKNWEEFFSLTQKITEVDDNLNVFTSLVSFGEFRNVSHAKEIISTLIMQAGSPIVVRDDEGPSSYLYEDFGKEISPAEEAVNFFVQFSNPAKPVYTWHRALPNSTKAFLSGDLALYFGFASELSSLRVKNPNLNFDVTVMPQTLSGNVVTFGNTYGLAIPKASDNTRGAFGAILALVSDDIVELVSDSYTNLPPVKRSLLVEEKSDPYLDVFYRSALFTKAWLDPNNFETDNIFEYMIDSIVSGRSKTSSALRLADEEINVLLGK